MYEFHLTLIIFLLKTDNKTNTIMVKYDKKSNIFFCVQRFIPET